jgi:glycosyltransferase involved in cell wall biosynthesis
MDRVITSAEPPLLSVVLCTWNRAPLLDGALRALVAQCDPPPHEILVVDNASTDDTRVVVERFCVEHPQVRYTFERRPGLSHARNTGVSATTGRAVAFTDDDVRASPGWLRAVASALRAYPDAACLGGPVLPAWTGPVPAWLTAEQWSALGAQNYSAEPFRVDHARPLCLIGANLVVRRDALAAVGPFDPAVQRVGDGIGSTEDHEFHVRLWATGRHGVYEPSLGVEAVVASERMAKRYHRRWHFGHGRHIARMRLSDMERTRRRILGVPAHVIRQAASDGVAALRHALAGDEAAAFDRELKLWFAAGFVRERWIAGSTRRRLDSPRVRGFDGATMQAFGSQRRDPRT